MIEQLYSDLTNNLLPKIQEGLVISKDYFLDLFGRYQHYLIVTDSIGVGIGLIVGVAIVLFGFKMKKNMRKYDSDDIGIRVCGMFVLITLFLILMILCGGNLIKDIYIPEIRMLEVIKNYN